MMDLDSILKYFAGKAGPEEALQIEEWVAASPENRSRFESLHQSWLRGGSESFPNPDVQQEWAVLNAKTKQEVLQTTTSKPAGFLVWLRRIAAAAAIAGVSLAGYYMFNDDHSNQSSYILPAEGRAASITLQDGSSVTVQESGELVYPKEFALHLREVTLVGDGNFNISSDPARPFVVHLGESHVKVLGTTFSVRRARGQVQVAVSSGKVLFYHKKDTITLHTGQTGIFHKATKKFTQKGDMPTVKK